MLSQHKDRDSTFGYPNEEVEDLIEQGRKMWFNEIDLGKTMIVPREKVDQILVKLGIV